MEDRDGKKTFIIPKTHTSTKDVLISEKTDSRNVIELFNDIKTCSLELHFDFRENQCKSCDMIRNQKLQKLYNERKIQMKKERDPTERLAFHLITSRDMALNIATDGLSCEQLTFSINKYLGNPNDGIHLSRRPDVLLASSGAQGLYKFGLLVCKILLSKGYPTIPSINNKQLSAQLHYDYHFCKFQSKNKEQRHIDDLLANSLIYCYEHQEFQTLSYPTQILPLAILWYDLTEKFSTELIPTSQESHTKNSYTKKPPTKPILSSTTGTWEEPTQESSNILTIQTTPTKYPNQLMIPYSSFYATFCSSQQDPRLIRTIVSSETIPLSPQNALSDLSFKQTINEKKNIPLNSTIQLIDPRLKTIKQPQKIFYLESKAVKHALQQQKRLNNYYGSTAKTNYTLIPFHIRSISSDEYERNNQLLKNSSALYISVIDCFHFGLKKSTDELCIDLEENENRLAFEQIQISDRLIQQERQLKSQEIRLNLREKRQRKIQEQIAEQKKNELTNSKIYMQNGRKLLKEHQERNSANNQISLELLDFFSYEYRHENRPYVKRILAEFIGIFMEKYGLDYQQMTSKIIEAPVVDNQIMNSAIDMELSSPFSQGLNDHDERFRMRTPPIIESTCNQPLPSLPLIQTSNESNITSEESNHNNTQLVQPTSEPVLLTNDVTFTENDEVFESPSNENNHVDSSTIDDNLKQMIILNPLIEVIDDSSRLRDEFVKLLTKEASISKSPSSSQTSDQRRRSHDEDDDESNSNKKLSSTRTVTLISNNHQDKLIIETTNVDQEKGEDEEEEEEEEEEEQQPTVKRIKVDLISPPPLPDNDKNLLVTVTDDHDYRQDLDERRRQEDMLRSRSRSRSRSKSTSSRNSSTKESKIRSPSSSSSSRTSSKNNHYRQERRNDYNRSYYHQRNINNSTVSRHQRFNYNHQSVAEHPRFAHIDTIPSPEKNYNYNSFSTSNYSQSRTNNYRNSNSSYYNESQSDYPYYQDNYNNNLPQPPPLMSTSPLMNFSNSYDSKPSNTIERLQMFLENSNTSYDYRESSIHDYSSSPYSMHSSENINNHPWSSARYSSGETADRNRSNNQPFTCNDAEQLLTFVQHLRN